MTIPSERLHRAITARLVLETVAVHLGLAIATLAIADAPTLPPALLVAVIVAQGCWFHRLYLVGHEAVHHKLIPGDRRLNDLVGQLILAPLLVPLPVYRAIHGFHHGHNRRDPKTSALETVVLPEGAGWARRLIARIAWFVAVFAGGFFLHSLVSIVLFLALPLAIARRISPAFLGWSAGLRARSLAAFAVGLALHLAVGLGLGARAWALTLGLPFLAFAWVYSLFVYIYHYDTSYGSPVRNNVRSLRPQPLISWWLLHFNEHATHHADASIPWYRLATARTELPPEYAANQRVSTFAAAILQQLRGPRFMSEAEARER